MGRKLNALEELQTLSADPDADEQDIRAQRRQLYLKRIADQLGITTAELSEGSALPMGIQPMIDSKRQSELVLTQQCRDLVEAFVQIQDPQDRLRCLQIVREASLK